MPIPVQCGSCRKRFSAKEQLAGRTVKCPQCGGALTIPASCPEPETVRRETESSDEDALAPPPARVAEPSTSAGASGESTASTPEVACPSCNATLKTGAVLCVQCGYNLRTGQKLEASRRADDQTAPKSSDKAAVAARAAGPYVLGSTLSLVGVLIGAALWYVVALIAGVENGWIAWGVGFLGGLGMLLGSRQEDDLAGITAAFISIVGIFAAKWLIYATILAAGVEDLVAAEIMLEETPDGEVPPLTYWSLFGPFEGFCILLAFFTAYSVGSGKFEWGGD